MEIFIRILKGVLLGAVQGLTEFLPVSSSGHLILIEKLGVAPPSVTLNLFLHLATLLALVIVLRRDFWELFKNPLGKKSIWILCACIPTAIVALLIKYFFPTLLEGGYLAPCFTFSAIVLLLPKGKKTSDFNLKNALFTGLMQGFAVLPALSRSGFTTSAMRLCGIDESISVKTCFLLSFPVILGGLAVELPQTSFSQVDYVVLISGFVAAFLFGLAALKVMLKAFCRRSSIVFSVYLFALSLFCLFLHL